MMRSTAPMPEMARAASHMLHDFLKVKPGETILVTTDTAGDAAMAEAIVTAGMAADCRTSVLSIPQLPLQGSLSDSFVPPTVAGAAGQADVWIDLTFPYLAGSHAHAGVMERNSLRYLLCSDMNGGGMCRIFGGAKFADLLELQKRLSNLMAESVGKEVHITSPLGTDVRFTLAHQELSEDGDASKPGMHMLPGSSGLMPELDSVRGTVTVETVFHEFYTPLKVPVTFHMDGRIQRFDGGGTEATVLDRVLRRAGGGEDYGYIIHFTHGFHPAAQFTGQSFVEDMRVVGSNAVGLGLPFWVPGGGENHPDAVMSMQSIAIEGEPLVEHGALVGAFAELGAALQPYYR